MPYRTVPRRTAVKKEIPFSPRPAAPRIIDSPGRSLRRESYGADERGLPSVGSEIFMKK